MRRRRPSCLGVLILLLLIPLAFSRMLGPHSHGRRYHVPQETVPSEIEFSGKVVGISDGDTIRVMHEGREERVRLFGIDCPERGQAYGSAARKFTSSMAFGKVVTVEVYDTDQYGRTVGIVVTENGRVLNSELVKAGLAWWYREYAPDDRHLADLENQARMAKIGLWADPHPIPPWEFRREGRG